MMTRQEVITMAAMLAVHASGNETQRRDNVKAAIGTAKMLADELGLKDVVPEQNLEALTQKLQAQTKLYDEAVTSGAHVSRELEKARTRIAELEAELEKATAPTAKGKVTR